MFRTRLLPLLCYALLLGTLPLARAARAEDRWTEVRSPHFRVFTNGSVADARRVATEFEQVRYVVHWRFPAFRLDADSPMSIVAVRDADSAEALQPKIWKGPGSRLAGYFFPSWERNYAMIRLDSWSRDERGARQVVYHEYVHSILHLNAHWLPMWLDEGMAEFFAYTQFEKNQILLGAPTERWRAFNDRRLLPVSAMLSTRESDLHDDRKVQLFYAEAWAMVHYMTFGPGMEGGKLLGEFYRRIQSGTDQLTAFQAVFGDPAAFDLKLGPYTDKYLLNAGVIPPAPPMDPSDLTERTLSPAERLYQMAAFRAGTGDAAGARPLVEQALALDPKLPPAHEQLGFLDFYEGDVAKARLEWQSARALDPSLFRSQFAEIMTGVPLRQQTPEQRTATLAGLREVVKANRLFAPSYVELALVFWWQGDLDAAQRAVSQAESLEPWRPAYHLLTARLLLARGKYQQAAALAHRTAELYFGTDRAEAVQLWDEIPPNGRGDLPALTYHLPPGAKVVEGTLAPVACGSAGSADALRLQQQGNSAQALDLSAQAPLHAGFADTLWVGGMAIDFRLCKHPGPHPAMIAYLPTEPNRGKVLWVDLLNDLPPTVPAAAPTATQASAAH